MQDRIKTLTDSIEDAKKSLTEYVEKAQQEIAYRNGQINALEQAVSILTTEESEGDDG